MFLVLSRGTLNLSQAQVHETGVSGRWRKESKMVLEKEKERKLSISEKWRVESPFRNFR